MACGPSMPAARRRRGAEYIARGRPPGGHGGGILPRVSTLRGRRSRSQRAARSPGVRLAADHRREPRPCRGAQTKPPVPPVRTCPTTYFGVAASDPYRYFEDLQDPDVATWIKAEADVHAKAVLPKVPNRGDIAPGNTATRRRGVARVIQRSGRRRPSVYYEKRLANENIASSMCATVCAGKERLLVDPDAVKARPASTMRIDYYAPSPDNKYLAYGMSTGGSEEAVLHVIEVATGKPRRRRHRSRQVREAVMARPTTVSSTAACRSCRRGAPADRQISEPRVYVHQTGR